MANPNGYVSAKPIASPCQALHIGADGLASECKKTPVWELSHFSGGRICLCEHHIEFYWNYELTFRSAVRDIWPLNMKRRLL